MVDKMKTGKTERFRFQEIRRLLRFPDVDRLSVKELSDLKGKVKRVDTDRLKQMGVSRPHHLVGYTEVENLAEDHYRAFGMVSFSGDSVVDRGNHPIPHVNGADIEFGFWNLLGVSQRNMPFYGSLATTVIKYFPRATELEIGKEYIMEMHIFDKGDIPVARKSIHHGDAYFRLIDQESGKLYAEMFAPEARALPRDE
jgi:hypothetical protein